MRRLARQAADAPEPSAACLADCRGGDRAAIEQVFAAYGPSVERMLLRLVGPVADLEDLVQTTFVEALTALARFRGEASFKTWLFSIAIHVGHRYLRAGKIRRHVPLDLVPEETVRGEPEHDRLLDERRLAPELHRLLDALAPQKRIALVLYVVEGHAMDEVARLMNASVAATRSRVFFARRELRKLLVADARLSAHVEALIELGGDR